MSENSSIQWCDHTFNPWEGCTKVSPGCAHCYAEARNHRFGGDNWGAGKPRRRTSEANWKLPLKWNDQPMMLNGRTHRPARVFCESLADWLDDEVPIEWLADLLRLIHSTENLDWLLLTKRPQNWRGRILSVLNYWIKAKGLCGASDSDFTKWLNEWFMLDRSPENIWIGTSVEDQKRADERIPELLKIPAGVRFLSVEPMLEAIDLAYSCFNGADSLGTMPGIHWAIFGGESGPKARPCNINWIRDGVRQCRAAGVVVFVKQLGRVPWHGALKTKHYQFNDPKGGDPSEWPEDLRVREFPTSAPA